MSALRWTIALAAGAALLAPDVAGAWETIACATDPQYRIAYPDDRVWPLVLQHSLPPGSDARRGVDAAVASWNAVPGALDVFTVARDGDGQCGAALGVPELTVGLDQGVCMSWAGNAWGPSQSGTTVFWQEDCALTRVVTYVNGDWPLDADGYVNTFTHELGHAIYYAHNWERLSVMGYTWLGVPPMTTLAANDHAYMRGVFGHPHDLAADLFVHRHAQLDLLGDVIVEGSASYGLAPPPTCSPGSCARLAPGDTVSLIVTVGNAGDLAVAQAPLTMTLGPHTLGAWTIDDLTPESNATFRFTGVVPADYAPGEHDLRVAIDPDDTIFEVEGAAADNAVVFERFTRCDAPCGEDAGAVDTATPEADTAPEADATPEVDAAPEADAASGGGADAVTADAPPSVDLGVTPDTSPGDMPADQLTGGDGVEREGEAMGEAGAGGGGCAQVGGRGVSAWLVAALLGWLGWVGRRR